MKRKLIRIMYVVTPVMLVLLLGAERVYHLQGKGA